MIESERADRGGINRISSGRFLFATEGVKNATMISRKALKRAAH
jgi:hypothetical protein